MPFDDKFPSLDTTDNKPDTTENKPDTSWNTQLTFNDIPIKKETKTLLVNQKVVKADQKNKVIFYLEDRMEICRDLLANQRLNIPVTHSKKMSGPDKDGFRTICPRKSTFKKTNY